MKSIHKHPLTLIENSGELRCYQCNQHLDEYFCRNCNHMPYLCHLCRDTLSGSCYTCKPCWNSPIVHQSCFELPEKIQITYYRPHCLLRFYTDSSGLREQHCDFCNKKHSDYMYRCGDCGFQIGVGCASKIINWHKDQQHVEHFSHRHPLTLLKFDDMICMLCYKHIDGPSYAYGCAPCEFYIHDSCLDEFLPEILHNFHPKHSLTLQDYIRTGNGDYPCQACGLDMKGCGYGCDKCHFDFHPKCITLKPNIKYEGHDHLLILLENSSYNGKCEACGFYIEDSFCIRCVECRLNFHVQCGSESLPPTVSLKEHKHPLSPIIAHDDSHALHCNVCMEEINHKNHFYKCVECVYFAHVRCSITEVQYDDKGKLRHFSHDHILILRDIHENDDICCYGCGKGVQGSAYGCDPCQFYIHKSCAELPNQIYNHESHYSTLRLSNDYSDGYNDCHTCYKALRGFIYRCDFCWFRQDLECASLHPSVNLNDYSDECTFHEGQVRIAHFSHKHPLIFLEEPGVNCNLCYKNINGQCYGCAECEFYIHNSCGALLQEIRHPFHPRHSLKLLVVDEPYPCSACCFFIKGMRYQCEECRFNLHTECISLKPNIEFYFHKHPLTLIDNMYFQGQCEACGLTTLGTFFMRCVECNINFHVQCGANPLPLTILHKQSGHRLTLKTGTLVEDSSDQSYCIICNKERNQKHPTYYCVDLDYYAHVSCVITKVEVDEKEKVKHFSHRHFLFPLENKRNDNIICCACEKNIQASPAYGCESCEFYLHKSCADQLPREIQHPFHQHPLSLPNTYSREYHKCKACLKHYNSFSYQCQDCDFNLDLDCSLLLPSIRIESVHGDTLTFFKKLYDTPECDCCKFIPQNKLTNLDAFYVRCMRCDFSRHFLCCPLPITMEHDSHHHSLTLKDNFVDIFDGFDDDEFCCDFCETRQDAREPVYHCEVCNFAIDIGCVFSEVMQFLEGKHKGVEGRIISREITNNVKGLTYKNILQSLTIEECYLMHPFIDVATMIQKGTLLDILKELIEINHPANAMLFTKLSNIDEEIVDVDLFTSMARKVAQLESIDEALVDVRGYKIFPKLAPVLKKLLDKYGDIGDSCRLTQLLKTIPLTTLCVILQEMRDTNVIDINDDSIIFWWFHLKHVQKAGFRTDFAFDRVNKILQVNFLLSDESPIYSRPFYGIHKEIAELSKEIDERTKKIEILKKAAQDTVSGHSEWLRSEANDLNETLKLSWSKAASGLLE